MKIYLGTTSAQKISILEDFLKKDYEYELIARDVESGVPEQPIGLDTTTTGAINRARNAIVQKLNPADFGIGMEAGFVMNENIYSLVCVVAIVDSENKIYTGVSDYMPVPKLVSDLISQGHRFGEAIREFESKLNSDSDPELIQRTGDLIDRRALFREALERVSFVIISP